MPIALDVDRRTLVQTQVPYWVNEKGQNGIRSRLGFIKKGNSSASKLAEFPFGDARAIVVGKKRN